MTPYERLAAFDAPDALDGWKRTAPVLRAWVARILHPSSAETQMEALCAHVVWRWTPAALDACPAFAHHAAALRGAPCAADWEETTEKAYALMLDGGRAVGFDGGTAAHRAAEDAAWITVRDAVWPSVGSRATVAAWVAIYAAARQPDPRSVFEPAAESWIALALMSPSPKIAALGVLDFRAPPAPPDAYAVVWDALGGDLPTDGTDDGRRVRDGLDANGAPVPAWARRTALARCLVRAQLSQ